MKKITMDGVGYYLSCMLLFHMIYALRILGDGLFGGGSAKCGDWRFWVDVATLAAVCILIVLGVVSGCLILKRDDSVESASTLGREVTITELEDLTGENYFANYSVLVLTALSLPVSGHIYGLGIYLFLLVTLGIVYIKKAMFYMNPLLTFMNYSIYRCRDGKSGEVYVFVILGETIKESETIRFRNMSGHIVRLKRVVRASSDQGTESMD